MSKPPWLAAGKTVLHPAAILFSILAAGCGCAVAISPKCWWVLGTFAVIITARWLLTTLGFWVADSVNSIHSRAHDDHR